MHAVQIDIISTKKKKKRKEQTFINSFQFRVSKFQSLYIFFFSNATMYILELCNKSSIKARSSNLSAELHVRWNRAQS